MVTHPEPADAKTLTAVETSAIAAWDKKESLTLYLLMLKVVPTTYVKHKRKGTAAKIWYAIVTEYTSKSMLACSNLHHNFSNM